MRRQAAIALLALLTACKADNPALGPLQTKVVSGRSQTVTAGFWDNTSPATNLSYRSRAVAQTPLWQRALLPSLLHAQTSIDIQVQPGAVACVSENQTVLIPKTRCVTADALGQSRFDFLETHVAGCHKALLNATYGLEATTFDTVTICVQPDVASPTYQVSATPLMTSPAVVPDNFVQDRWGNSVPFRVVGDSILTVAGDTVGTLAARTISYVPNGAPNSRSRFTELRGSNNALVGWLRYTIGGSGDPRIYFEAYGTSVKP